MPAPGKVVRVPDVDALARASADDFAALAAEAIVARGVFHVALSGGSTPKKTFALLAGRGKAALPWHQIVLWWGDERTVPPDHPDSNYGMAKQQLIDPLGLDSSRVHRMVGEGKDFAAHAASAAAYEAAITQALGAPPVFDLIMLGMGPDGHCASLFPKTPALDDATHWVVANQLAETNLPGKTVRITLTPRAINAARHVRFAIGGADKAKSLAAVLEGPRDPHTYPSQLIAPASGDLVWQIEAAAAAALKGGAS